MRSAHTRWTKLAEHLPVGAFLADAHGRCLFVNRRWCELTGLTATDALGDGWMQALHPEDRDTVVEAWQRSAAWAAPFEFDYRFRRADGTVVWVAGRAHVETDERGAPLAYVGTVTDVTRHKQAELERAHLQELIDASLNEIYVVDPATLHFRYVNAGALRNLGYSLAALRNMTPVNIQPEFSEASYRAMLAPLVRGEQRLHVLQTVQRRANGSEYPVEVRLQHVERGGERVLLAVILDLTERRAAERALRVAERSIAASISGVAMADLQARITYVNQAFLDLWGYTSTDEVLGRSALDFWVRPGDAAGALARLHEDGAWTGELTARSRAGDSFIVQIAAHLVPDAAGRPLCLMASFVDVTARRQAEAERDKLSRALHDAADMVMITDRDGTIEYVNPAFEQATGYTREEAVGRRPGILKSGCHDAAFYADMWSRLLRGEVFRDVMINRRKDGALYYEQKTITPLAAPDGAITHFIVTGTDITERMQVQERLRRLAHHDALTDLPNRFLFTERLRHAVVAGRRRKRRLAVLFLDLDRFKLINDSFGHAAGDAALRVTAARLKASLREEDTVARLGGDEFAVLIDDVASPDAVAQVAGKLLEAVATAQSLEGRDLVLTASIGIALCPDDGKDAATLLRRADAAMYRAKDDGRNAYVFYSARLGETALERLVLETSLRHALARNEFELHYQPQIALDSGEIVGAEALLRWHHPDGRLVPAAHFIPLAEETALITEIDEWVIRAATNQLRTWQQAGEGPASIAINLSGRSLRKATFTDGLAALVREARVDPRLLEFELTEGVVMTNAEVSAGLLRQLSSLGCRFAIDDFGTGYSSLSYLRRFPISVLKIDRSFVQSVLSNRDDATIVRTIVAMAHSLAIRVVAEGVESPEQLAFLRACGCTSVQGHLFSGALPAAAFIELMRGRAHPA